MNQGFKNSLPFMWFQRTRNLPQAVRPSVRLQDPNFRTHHGSFFRPRSLSGKISQYVRVLYMLRWLFGISEPSTVLCYLWVVVEKPTSSGGLLGGLWSFLVKLFDPDKRLFHEFSPANRRKVRTWKSIYFTCYVTSNQFEEKQQLQTAKNATADFGTDRS